MSMNAAYQELANQMVAGLCQLGDHESVLDVIYDYYLENNAIETSEMKVGFEMLHSLLEEKMCNETEGVIDAVCALCSEYERVAFIDGLQIGIRLAQELNIA